jgi:hypothetical protein
MDALGVVYPQY